ncbi:malto-oligosyltrehalose trehalohydrolase [Streptomyces iconiensis]|uniref:Malto-oligosyltrehalose trehalohydrolase n=1 Tax=Streptomyces iconiensis TaxID=1384038 RepID=A0ABT6ZWX5_9ACTN|nr:malto-oligosyltrehalose trehalohydrolase [Streptomyces iconiensis]MDJ1133579.1 malto-oligosyltrehalose trehalohydrolase [Streptomyces iconiensis]
MRFEVWAPGVRRVGLWHEGGVYGMDRSPTHEGWWQAEVRTWDGARYGFSLDGGGVLPDPRSRRQPDGPEGLSAVVDHDGDGWRHAWRGRPLPGAVLYEVHIGTFTREGTFDGARERLAHVAGLGVTHVELMPVCPFPGTHGWGYDGVAPWAVHEPYGGPVGLKRFVDAAHGQGLGVVLDVVHNHLGPSGNHLPAFGPYFTERHRTPWGAAVNLDGPGSDEVRGYLIGSALAFLRDYQLDGLRLDAVHALADTRAEHFLAELSEAVDTMAARTGRPLFLIAESDLNDPRTTAPRTVNGHGVHAQWNDDFHHALHVAVTGESDGYYADFARSEDGPLGALAKTLTGAFFHDGGYSSFRGRRHGRAVRPETATPAHRFLAYAQTHDQVGNRALGERLSALAPTGLLACAAALVLLSPGTPLLFMGEEWGAGTPWQYFTDHQDAELAEAVRQGRRREFAAHGWPAERVPDPQDPATRERSCLDWNEPERAPHAELLEWYRALASLRHSHPLLAHTPLGDARVTRSPADSEDRWLLLRNGPLHVAVNLAGDRTAQIPLPTSHAVLLTAWDPGTRLDEGVLSLPPESAAVLH